MRERRGCLLPAVGLFFGLPLLLLCALAWLGPPSGETMALSAVVLVFVIACAMAHRRDTRVVMATCVVLALGIVVYRLNAAAEGTTVNARVEPDGEDGRWIDRIVPERDIALGASRLLVLAGKTREPGLLDALRDGYDRMDAAEGALPSPVIGTFLLGQRPREHVVLHVARERLERPSSALVFLHGSMGGVTVECWQVAQAALPVGLEVVCPSTDWRARWANAEGRQIVQGTIGDLRARGVRRIYVAGLSAGAIGLSRIASSLDVQGIVLLSGASSNPRPRRVPTLVLQGRRDRMTPPAPARAYARRASATYREHPTAGHWMILSEHEWTTNELQRWLARQEGVTR